VSEFLSLKEIAVPSNIVIRFLSVPWVCASVIYGNIFVYVFAVYVVILCDILCMNCTYSF
jgi:hypothetical protein